MRQYAWVRNGLSESNKRYVRRTGTGRAETGVAFDLPTQRPVMILINPLSEGEAGKVAIEFIRTAEILSTVFPVFDPNGEHVITINAPLRCCGYVYCSGREAGRYF